MITHDQWIEVAKRLGDKYEYLNTDLGWCLCYDRVRLSAGDALLAILNRAAEMGWTYELKGSPSTNFTGCRCWKYGHVDIETGRPGFAPLEAAILAFIQLPASQGDA